jgi:AcrR family transcriptional regulator
VAEQTTELLVQVTPRVRADAQRSIDALVEASRAAFAMSGVYAPVREIATRAGVGIATVYRHFPQRSDLIAAVFKNDIQACADAADTLAAEHDPDEALERWLQRYTDLLATKHGLAAALNSEAPTYEALPACFQDPLLPALTSLLESATTSGRIRAEIGASDLLQAVASLCLPAADNPDHAQRMVALLVDGLRYGANPPD